MSGRSSGKAKGSIEKHESIIKTKDRSNKQEKDRPDVYVESNKYKCTMCGRSYDVQKNNFPFSQSPFFKGNNSYLPICNHCFDDSTNQYQKILGNQDEAIKRMCLHWDMYVSDVLLESSKKISLDRSRIKGYVSKLNMQQYAGRTYDTYLKECESNAITSLDDLDELQESSNTNINEKTVKTWGFGFSLEDYEFLNAQYSDWRAKVIIDTKARESLVRELCIIKLQQNKALQSDKIDLYDKLTNTYQKTLGSAELKPCQEDANERAGEKPMGVMIDIFENDRPIPEPLDEWKDVDGIIRLFTIYFLGHLCKMLGLKNRYSKMYEEEMAKYRVEVPDLKDSDDDDVFDYVINNGSDLSKDGEEDGS